MPILKVEILSSIININYEDDEKTKLLELINSFKKRLKEFPENLKINDKSIIFLSALKLEDELKENKKLLSKSEINKIKIDEKSDEILNLNKELLLLQNRFDELSSKDEIKSANNLLVLKKINNLESQLKSILIKIKNEFK